MKSQKGLTLIEVLVSIVVLSLAVIGTVSMQMNALRYNQSSLNRSQATYAANDILDRMRANRSAATAGNYNITTSATATASTTIASQDLAEWRANLSQLLPEGTGGVSVSSNVVTITIQWDERRAENSSSAELQSFVYTSEL